MTYSFLSGTNPAVAGSSTGGTTAGVDTTGANLIVVAISRYVGGGAHTVTDSKSNTYTALTEQNSSANDGVRIYYCYAPTVGSGHTFTVAGTYTAITAAAFSGAVASPFDLENGATVEAPGSSIQPGSITPSQDNCLVVCATSYLYGAEGATIDSGFTELADEPYSAGNFFGLTFAYKIQTTAAAVNPTITVAGGSIDSRIASFKASAGGGAGAELQTAASCSASIAATLTTAIKPAASVSASVSVNAALTTAIKPAASVSASVSVNAALTTAIKPAASVSASVSVNAALTTAIKPAASVSATATVAAALAGGAAQLATSVAASAATSAALTTGIALAANAAGAATASAQLAGTAATLAAAASASASVTAALTTGITIAAGVAGAATVSANLSTSSSAWAVAATAQASATAALTTAVRLAASASGAATVAADLTTQAAAWAVAAIAQAQASAALTTAIRLQAQAQASASVIGAINVFNYVREPALLTLHGTPAQRMLTLNKPARRIGSLLKEP